MNSFVVLASKNGHQINPSVRARIEQPELPDLHFVPESYLFWSNAGGSIAYCGWQAAADVGGRGSHWHQSPRGLSAFSGVLYPKSVIWNQARTWAENLDWHWSTCGVPSLEEDFCGIYTAVRLPGDGTGYVISDPFAVGLLYTAEADDVFVVSNRASLAARAITNEGGLPARDASTMSWLPFYGYIIGEATGFLGVTTLPPDAYVVLDVANGPSIRRRPRPVWQLSEFDLPQDTEGLIDQVHRDLRDNVRAIASLPGRNKTVQLTGGKDSRLILSLIHAAGLEDEFSFVTFGLPNAPDVQVAKQIAESFGLKFTHESHQPTTELPFEERLRRHVFQTSGMYGAWDLKGGLGISQNLTVSGVFGELLRSFYGKWFTPKTEDDLYDLVMNRLQFDVESLLRDEVRERCRVQLWDWMVAQLENGVAATNLLDVFYLQQRVRRWFGAGYEVENALMVFPLQSPIGLRTSFRLSESWRRTARLHFEITRRCNRALAKMPFADDAWHEECYAHLPDANEYRAATPLKSEGPAPTQWQMVRLEANRDVFARYLVEDPSNPLFTVLDQERVRRVVEERRNLSHVGAVQLYGALTAAVWLGHYEEAARMQFRRG